MATQPIVRSVAVQNAQGNSENATVQRLYNFHTATAPAVTDDVNDGYEVGDMWINGATGQQYLCDDTTAGAAVWTAMNPSAAVIPADYTAQTVLVAVANATPLPQTVAAGEFVGRAIAGNIGVITAAQARAIINASTEAEFDAIADASVINADRMVDDSFTTAQFAAGAGGLFAAGALNAAGAANLIADSVLLARMNAIKTVTVKGAGAAVATAAELVGGIFTHAAAGAPDTFTTDTAANIIANAAVGATVGTSFEITIVNGGAGTSQLTGGVGVTVTGDTDVATGTSGTFLGVVTGAANVVFVRK